MIVNVCCLSKPVGVTSVVFVLLCFGVSPHVDAPVLSVLFCLFPVCLFLLLDVDLVVEDVVEEGCGCEWVGWLSFQDVVYCVVFSVELLRCAVVFM